MQVNAAAEGKFEDVEVAWGGQPAPRQVAEFKFKQVGAIFQSFYCGVLVSKCSRSFLQEMDTRLEYDKAKAVKWLMAPGLVEISAREIADAHNERKAREISRYRSFATRFTCFSRRFISPTTHAEKLKKGRQIARCMTAAPPPSKWQAWCKFASLLLPHSSQ